MFQEYLNKIKRELKVTRLSAVLYARYSSDIQRSESIDAQIRAIKLFAQQHDIIILREYIDEAQSAKYDDREAFQRMISDASKISGWQLLLVHKLDRFARNRYDSANYRVQLRRNNKYLISVTEQLDDSPESVMLEAVIEGMAEYYSKNLSREVMKGMKENALQGITCGGIAPLGYDIDPVTKKLIVNSFEAQAVKLIFARFLEGVGYSGIIHELNNAGYKTKKGCSFVKNSIHDILRNEKYTGVYVYNRRKKSDDFTGKRNNHSLKPEDEIIKVQNAFAAIISKEDFEKVQMVLKSRKRAYTNNAKEHYLLSGKLVCGVCGSSYVGTRKIRNEGKKYIYYMCNIKERSAGIRCSNTYITRDCLESAVLEVVQNFVLQMDNTIIDDIYEQCLGDYKKNIAIQKKVFGGQLDIVERDIKRIVDVITTASSPSLMERLNSLEQQKSNIKQQIFLLESATIDIAMSRSELKKNIEIAKKMLKEKSIPKLKELIDLIVEKVIINKENVKIYLNYCDLSKLKKKLTETRFCVAGHYGDLSSAPVALRLGSKAKTRLDASFLLMKKNGLKPMVLSLFCFSGSHLGAVDGCAVTLQHMVQDMNLMQDMNANAVRTCHYPNDERFLDLCDERGIFV